MNCPSIEQLFAFAQSELPLEVARDIGVHLEDGCLACGPCLEQLKTILSATADQGFREPPAWLVDQALEFFRRIGTESGDEPARSVTAFLVADSFTAGRLAGFRGSGPVSRQILYRTDGYDIVLSMAYIERAKSLDIMGQLMPMCSDSTTLQGARVELLGESGITFGTGVNEFGEFIMEGVREGTYEMRIRVIEREIRIPAFVAVVRRQRGLTTN